MEMYAADTSLVGYHIDTEVGIAQVLVDALHDALQQLLIGRLETYLVHLLFEFIVTLVLKA